MSEEIRDKTPPKKTACICDTRLDEIGSYKLYTIAETSVIIIVIVNTRMKSYEKYCYFYRQ